MLKGLTLKKIKTMNNKMAKNIILSTIGYKKQTKKNKNRDRIMDMEKVLMVARWEGYMGGWVKR